MGHFIHARRTEAGLRFRVWSSIVDRYTTEELDEPALCELLIEDYTVRELRSGHAERHLGERLTRAKERGTSVRGPTRSLDGPWDTERCRECNRFHHAYEGRGRDGCANCGEPREDVAHQPPCESEGSEG